MRKLIISTILYMVVCSFTEAQVAIPVDSVDVFKENRQLFKRVHKDSLDDTLNKEFIKTGEVKFYIQRSFNGRTYECTKQLEYKPKRRDEQDFIV